jgi:signal transduction histidine kinase
MQRVSDEQLARIATSDEHLHELRALNISSLMILPIVSHGIGVGAMTLAYAESGRTYDETDLEFFQEFCHHVSVVFDNARLFEEIEMRDKSKDIFLAALSHELRNPLAPIKSSLELIKMREIPQELREEIDIIEHQFDHMAKLLNDLLDVTRFTQDRISLSSHPIDLRRLIERALRGTDALVRQADITLHFAYPSAPMSVAADETRLEQAVSNLISNAIKFTPAGGSIWVDLERSATHATVRVRDNGAGIDQEDLPNIFDMYYQGQNKGTVNSGLGIGLLLVQRIIALHGGTVTAKSDGQGKGSEFEIQLPLVESAVQERQGTLPLSIARSMRILVVDDNAPAADSLVRLLNKLGGNATAVYSGYEALGIHRLNEIDLFILDVGMPHMNGYELVAALRSRGITAPITALTGYGLSDDKKRALEAGFTSHLTKPVGIAELNTLFESVLATA